ncbi:MAG TPA: cytochrome c3 family protein [Candidatus Methylacidiphilales bacterium]|jgi:predicted CXXCH cytochrome family protein|nr:cytochrome c3 family protein [Candidatus Methylacidiphilales bacterium]
MDGGEIRRIILAASRRNRRASLFVSGLLLIALTVAVVSCADMSGTQVVAPPQIQGATFVGSEACETCHQDIAHDFVTATHYKLKAPGDNAKNIGCESCHGAGSVHVASGGGPKTIINPGKSPEICFQCHLDKEGQFNLPSHHPVLEGKVSCADCHDPHKGSVVEGGGTNLAGQNDVCFKCHTAQQGPFVFEHEAMREGCTTCHNPHGSVNARLLVSRNATLCLRCHFQQQTTTGAIFIGDVNHTSFLSRGTCWSAGCHEAIHGSQVNPHLRY